MHSRIERLAALEQAATKGPWEWQSARTMRHLGANGSGLLISMPNKKHRASSAVDEANAAIIVESRNALPALIAILVEIEETSQKPHEEWRINRDFAHGYDLAMVTIKTIIHKHMEQP